MPQSRSDIASGIHGHLWMYAYNYLQTITVKGMIREQLRGEIPRPLSCHAVHFDSYHQLFLQLAFSYHMLQ